jgi:hypothetical protein
MPGKFRHWFFVAVASFSAAFATGLPLQAMTLQTVEKTCPYDGTKFQFQEQVSGTSFDRTLDLKPVGAIQSPSPLAVCPTNGFVFVKDDYSVEELERLRPLILSPEYQALKDETAYYRAAWISQRTGATEDQVVTLLLRASWEAAWAELDARLAAIEAEQVRRRRNNNLFGKLMAQGTSSERYVRYAGELLVKLRAAVPNTTDEKVAKTRKLLIVELLRRLKRFDEAERQLAAIVGDFPPGSGEAKVAAFQRTLIAKQDAGVHMMSAVFGRTRK